MAKSQGRRDDIVRRRADEVVRLVEANGSPAHVRAMVRCYAEEAPEVLSLGPVPATFATRLLHGLCSPRPAVRRAFLETVRREAELPPSPTVASMLRADLLAASAQGDVDATARGRALLERLERVGAIRPTPGSGPEDSALRT